MIRRNPAQVTYLHRMGISVWVPKGEKAALIAEGTVDQGSLDKSSLYQDSVNTAGASTGNGHSHAAALLAQIRGSNKDVSAEPIGKTSNNNNKREARLLDFGDILMLCACEDSNKLPEDLLRRFCEDIVFALGGEQRLSTLKLLEGAQLPEALSGRAKDKPGDRVILFGAEAAQLFGIDTQAIYELTAIGEKRVLLAQSVNAYVDNALEKKRLWKKIQVFS